MPRPTVSIAVPEDLARELPPDPVERREVLVLGLREWKVRKATDAAVAAGSMLLWLAATIPASRPGSAAPDEGDRASTAGSRSVPPSCYVDSSAPATTSVDFFNQSARLQASVPDAPLRARIRRALPWVRAVLYFSIRRAPDTASLARPPPVDVHGL